MSQILTETAGTEIPLENAGFEEGWREVEAPEVKVALGWHPWWHATDVRPEYKIATVQVDEHRIKTGNQAQQWFTTHATHTAGIYQQVVDITPGRDIMLTAWVQCFSRDDDTNWRVSDGRYRMRIGIDPYGGTDPESQDIKWSLVNQPYDDYSPLSVNTSTKSDRLTLFVWGQPEWAVKHNNAYVDDVELWYTDNKEPPEPPPDPGEYITREEAREIISEMLPESIGQMFPGLFKMHISNAMRRLGAAFAQAIEELWPT